MQTISGYISYFKNAYNEINSSTLTGALDVIIIRQPDGTYKCSPFHVRFGKVGIFRPREREVDIEINGEPSYLKMYLGEGGEAFFSKDPPNETITIIDRELTVTQELPELDITAANAGESLAPESPLSTSLPCTPRSQSRSLSTSLDSTPQHLSPKRSLPIAVSPNTLTAGVAGEDPSPKRSASTSSDATCMRVRSCSTTVAEVGSCDAEISDILGKGASFALSDVEFSPVGTPAGSRPVSPRSDTELDRERSRQFDVYSNWTWGNFPTQARPDAPGGDAESGYSQSGPQSPLPAQRFVNLSEVYPTIRMSLCGMPSITDGVTPERFAQYEITSAQFGANPQQYMSSPDLWMHLAGNYYPATVAVPMILSLACFRTQLPAATATSLLETHLNQRFAPSGGLSGWLSSWGSRRHKDSSSSATSNKLEAVRIDTDASTSGPGQPPQSPPLITQAPPVLAAQSPPLPTTIPLPAAPVVNPYSDSEDEGPSSQTRTRRNSRVKPRSQKFLRLSSEDIAGLNLKEGLNYFEFSVTSRYQGTSTATSCVYLWNWDEKIVISDIDGTVTRSDILGHILPLVGRDWSQNGVVELYNRIVRNGYKIVYLSTRAIGHADLTKDYLKTVQAKGQVLPQGPVLLSPSSLLAALYREVVTKNPEEFKISCLQDIASLFPSDRVVPFFAGFGNKPNDAMAYRHVGVPVDRIFIVNHLGEVRKQLSSVFQSSYHELSEIAEMLFPNLGNHRGQSLLYNTHVFWSLPHELNELADKSEA